MNDLALFTDASLNPKLRRGVGAALLVPAAYLKRPPAAIDRHEMIGRLKTQRFENTSSTKLEVQTVLWALAEYRLTAADAGKLTLYSDSACVATLLQRRARLERSGFLAGSTGRELKHSQLYRNFYGLYDMIGFEVVRVAGHSPSFSQNAIVRIFSCVDRQARKALKQWAGGRPL